VHSGAVWLGALILANFAYVGWGWSIDRPESLVPRPQLSSIGPSLRLLTELPADELQLLADTRVASASATAPGAEAKSDMQPMQMACLTWGPFTTKAELESVEAEIVAAGGQTRVTETTIPGRSDFLVYIGTPGKAENARRILEELKSQEIDSALITRGRFNNTLSVGVFSRRDRAEKQHDRVSKLGYEAGIREIDRSYNVFHLEARVIADFEPAVPPSGPCNEIAQAH